MFVLYKSEIILCNISKQSSLIVLPFGTPNLKHKNARFPPCHNMTRTGPYLPLFITLLTTAKNQHLYPDEKV